MEIKILAFGQIAELVGQPEFLVSDIKDTDTLKEFLASKYPAINAIAYAISVDKKGGWKYGFITTINSCIAATVFRGIEELFEDLEI